MSDTLHLLSLKVQDLRDRNKRERLKQYLKYQKVDIAFLQETHFTIDLVDTLTVEFSDWSIYNAFGTSTSRGCSISVHKKNKEHEIVDSFYCENGRFCVINIKVDLNTYTLVNVYAPNDRNPREKFFKNIYEFVNNRSVGMKIYGGDMNDTLKPIDRISSNNQREPVQSLSNLIKNQHLCDIWRETNEHVKQFTWRRKNGKEKSRIDYWLVEENLIPLLQNTDIRPALIHRSSCNINKIIKT